METVDIKPIDVSIVKKEQKETELMVKEAQAIIIKSQEDYIIAGDLRKKIKGKIKDLDEKRKSITAPLDLAKKNIMALFTPIIDMLNKGVENLDIGVIAYDEIQERKAREAQAKAEEEARKAREKAEARARELEAQGKTEKAQAMQEKADAIIAPIITTSTPKVSGQAIREIWYAEVVDFKALSDDYKLPNQSALDKVAQATKGKINLSGVKFYSRKIVSGRSI
jgi:hypothetical protein